MLHRYYKFAIAIAILAIPSLPLHAQAAGPPYEEIVRVEGTIVDALGGDARFSTLVNAVQTANLVQTLQGAGPFTVFAPTNDAFGQVPQPVLDVLLANTDQLSQVLTYHVTPTQSDIRFDYVPQALTTVQGQNVYVDREFDDLRINNSKVVDKVIQTSNGVIYVIDSVLLPQFRAPEPAPAAARRRTR